MSGVTEYCEGDPVFLVQLETNRMAIKAFNEAGYNSTEVDLIELIRWIKTNMPELLSNEGCADD